MEWIVVLRGNENDLNELSKVYTTPEFTIKKVVENVRSYYTLTSSGFVPSMEYSSVKEIAQIFVKDLTAGILLRLNSRRSMNNPSSSGINSRHAIDTAPPEKTTRKTDDSFRSSRFY